MTGALRLALVTRTALRLPFESASILSTVNDPRFSVDGAAAAVFTVGTSAAPPCTISIFALTLLATVSQDFLEMLPLKEYTHPTAGPLNLAAQLPEQGAVKPDLGPKSYIAYGRCACISKTADVTCKQGTGSCCQA